MRNERTKLPSAFSLMNSISNPTIDNQGGIGSCASQAATRNQFSNAVTKYAHSIYPNCQRDSRNPEECFSPKFTYNLSGAGTVWVYEILKDHGAISEAEFPFEKNDLGGHIKKRGDEWIAKSAEWPCAYPGYMKKALKNRITAFDRLWFDDDVYKCQLTTTEIGREVLNKIKASVVMGNFVVTGGYPSRWIYADIVNTGSYGKRGDVAVVAAAGTAGGGHQVTIVGYDDDVTCEFAGVMLRGAFIVSNSYGEKWKNEGYTYVMYDAVNNLSEFEALNNPEIYSGQMFITPSRNLCMYSETQAMASQDLIFEVAGNAEVYGKSYTAYNIKDKESGKYIGYYEMADNRAIRFMDEAGSESLWCLVPYEDLKDHPKFISEEYKSEYEGSYWIYATGRDCSEEGNRFLDAGVASSSPGRDLCLAGFNFGKYPAAKSWDVEAADGTFVSKLGIRAGKGKKVERIWTFDQFCFTNWETDIVFGLPELYIEFELEAANRDGFFVVMTRTDKDGNKEKYVPAMFRHGLANHHPKYCGEGEYNTFSGKVNGEAETGYFALSYSDLLEFPKGKTALDYTWGFDVIAKDGKVTVKNAVLYYGGSNTPLGKITRAKTVSKKSEFVFLTF